MRLVITGVPGSGKTALARALARKLGVEYVDLNKIAKKCAKLGKTDKGIEIDLMKLEKILKKMLKGKKSFVLEGHLACEIKIPCDLVVIMRCNPLVLMKRLWRRGYPKWKVIDNALAEAQDYFVFKTEKNYRNFIEVNATKKLSIAALLDAVKRRKGFKADWNKELFALASQGL